MLSLLMEEYRYVRKNFSKCCPADQGSHRPGRGCDRRGGDCDLLQRSGPDRQEVAGVCQSDQSGGRRSDRRGWEDVPCPWRLGRPVRLRRFHHGRGRIQPHDLLHGQRGPQWSEELLRGKARPRFLYQEYHLRQYPAQRHLHAGQGAARGPGGSPQRVPWMWSRVCFPTGRTISSSA